MMLIKHVDVWHVLIDQLLMMIMVDHEPIEDEHVVEDQVVHRSRMNEDVDWDDNQVE